MSDDHRLERIENKLDEVGKAIVALARVGSNGQALRVWEGSY